MEFEPITKYSKSNKKILLRFPNEKDLETINLWLTDRPNWPEKKRGEAPDQINLTDADYVNSKDACLFVAEHNGILLGCGQFAMSGRDHHVIVNYFVHYMQAKDGVGKTIMDTLVEIARRQGVSRLWGTIKDNNCASRRICEKIGFKQGEKLGTDAFWYYLEIPIVKKD